MANFGKKMLSVFVEMAEEKEELQERENEHPPSGTPSTPIQAEGTTEKFQQYFDRLFRDANLPGPDYFEFAKMTQAMLGIADERARYAAAFAGLSVQGLDKTKLLATAAEYVNILEKDAANFNATVDAALREKVQMRQQEITGKEQRITQLSNEISELQQQVHSIRAEVAENEAKIASNSGGYQAASAKMKEQLVSDIEKIKQHVG